MQPHFHIFKMNSKSTLLRFFLCILSLSCLLTILPDVFAIKISAQQSQSQRTDNSNIDVHQSEVVPQSPGNNDTRCRRIKQLQSFGRAIGVGIESRFFNTNCDMFSGINNARDLDFSKNSICNANSNRKLRQLRTRNASDSERAELKATSPIQKTLNSKANLQPSPDVFASMFMSVAFGGFGLPPSSMGYDRMAPFGDLGGDKDHEI